jgi:L-amino acid N-acyltransferase YncA
MRFVIKGSACLDFVFSSVILSVSRYNLQERLLISMVAAMSTFPNSSCNVRAARLGDIPQAHAIYSHYVLHTPTDMHHVPPSLASFSAEYDSLTSYGLPYLVAVALPEAPGPRLSEGTPSLNSDAQNQPDTERVLGFIHAFPFRGYKFGYSKTAELAIICHPDATKRGVGSKLMEAFLDALEDGKKIEQILAFMTVLEDAAEDRRVKRFYEKWGFREVGKLTDVGQKFGRR